MTTKQRKQQARKEREAKEARQRDRSCTFKAIINAPIFSVGR